jgi:small conductance mechanosensitive channel
VTLVDFSLALERLREMLASAASAFPNMVVALLVFLLFYIAARIAALGVHRFAARRQGPSNLAFVLARMLRWTVMLVGLLVALSVALPTFRAGDLVQLLGISSVAIGFAFKDILQNFLAGVLLLITQPFRLNDQIVFKDYEGTVEQIQTRATLLRTYDGRLIVIPNAQLFTESVIVNTGFDRRRLEADIGIGMSDDIEKARDLILQSIRLVPDVLKEPLPDVLVTRLADFSVVLRARWWIEPPRRANALDLQDKVLATIKKTLMENGIDLPFPTQQVLFHDQTEETDGDRARQREGWPPGIAYRGPDRSAVMQRGRSTTKRPSRPANSRDERYPGAPDSASGIRVEIQNRRDGRGRLPVYAADLSGRNARRRDAVCSDHLGNRSCPVHRKSL